MSSQTGDATPALAGPTAAPGRADETTAAQHDAEVLARLRKTEGMSERGLLALRIGFGVAMLALWQLASDRVLSVDTISSPSIVADRLGEWIGDGTLAENTVVTLKETALGFLVGGAAGIVCGIGLGLWRRLGDVVTPYVMGLYALPKLALAPLFILWFGIGTQMKVAMGALLVFFLVFLNTMAGVRDVDRSLMDGLKIMGASRRQMLWKLTLPGSMASIMLGLKLAVPYALIGAVVGELLAATEGLGFLITRASAQYDSGGVFACLVVLGVIALLMNQAVESLEKRLLAWKTASR